MNIKAYIESGILEQYVLGMTSDLENQEVQRYAKKYPEVRKEIDKIEAALFKYAQAYSVQPPPGARVRVLGLLTDLPDANPDPLSKTDANTTTDTAVKSSSSFWQILAFIASGLFAVLAYSFYSQKNTLENKNQQLEQKYQKLEKDCLSKTALREQMNKQIAMFRDENTQPIRMKGTALSPQSETILYWNDNKKTAYLDVASLPAPASGKQYQLWAIVDGKPVDMGVFDLPAQIGAFKEVTFIDKPQAFAVTLEPTGGVASPTMDQMYVMGET